MGIRKVSPEKDRRVERDSDVRKDTRAEDVVWDRSGPGTLLRPRYAIWARSVVDLRDDAQRREDEEMEIRETGL